MRVPFFRVGWRPHHSLLSYSPPPRSEHQVTRLALQSPESVMSAAAFDFQISRGNRVSVMFTSLPLSQLCLLPCFDSTINPSPRSKSTLVFPPSACVIPVNTGTSFLSSHQTLSWTCVYCIPLLSPALDLHAAPCLLLLQALPRTQHLSSRYPRDCFSFSTS